MGCDKWGINNHIKVPYVRKFHPLKLREHRWRFHKQENYHMQISRLCEWKGWTSLWRQIQVYVKILLLQYNNYRMLTLLHGAPKSTVSDHSMDLLQYNQVAEMSRAHTVAPSYSAYSPVPPFPSPLQSPPYFDLNIAPYKMYTYKVCRYFRKISEKF